MLKVSLSDRTSFGSLWRVAQTCGSQVCSDKAACASLRKTLGFRNNGSRENQISVRMFEVRRGRDGIA
jgi:hypothetical protein